MKINFRKFLCGLFGWWRWLYEGLDCQRYVPKPLDPIPPAPPPPPPLPPLKAKDYNGQLIGTTAYSLIRYPLEDIEWFLRELVQAGGNATEALLVTTWDDTWQWQPFKKVKDEKEMWKYKAWTPSLDYAYPVYDLAQPNHGVRDKWKQIFEICRDLNLTIIVRAQDYCSRKDNFLERHWALWSNIQSWRWGGKMVGGYLHWPIGLASDDGHNYIWPHYDHLNKWLVTTLQSVGVKYYLEPWNELQVIKGEEYAEDAPDVITINDRVHQWFADSFVKYGCPRNKILYNIQKLGRSDLDWAAHVRAMRNTGFRVELHGCASPRKMRDYINLFGQGRKTFPNGDGMDGNAEGINDGRLNYTEPSVEQAIEMGNIVKARNLFGYIYKNRSLRHKPSLRVAKFDAVAGLAQGIEG